MRKQIRTSFVVVMLAALAACQTPKLPDPKIEYQAPPAELMKPPEKMKPL